VALLTVLAMVLSACGGGTAPAANQPAGDAAATEATAAEGAEATEATR
jgi:hypothetical protein